RSLVTGEPNASRRGGNQREPDTSMRPLVPLTSTTTREWPVSTSRSTSNRSSPRGTSTLCSSSQSAGAWSLKYAITRRSASLTGRPPPTSAAMRSIRARHLIENMLSKWQHVVMNEAKTVHVAVYDTLADWEVGHASAHL